MPLSVLLSPESEVVTKEAVRQCDTSLFVVSFETLN